MSRARVRRPLIALIVLVLALIIGYTVRALESDDHPHPQPTHATHSMSP